MPQPRVAIVSGFWGQNIGNAFFNLGGHHLLSEAGAHATFVQDQSAYWTFRNEAKGSFDDWNLISRLDIDLLVLQGPLFTRNFANIWEDTLRQLDARGVRWAVLSAGLRSYSDEEVAVAKQVMDAVPPLFVSTRDEQTAEALQPIFPDTRSGICSAWFLPRAFTPLQLATDPYVAVCYDHFIEPTFIEDATASMQLGHNTYRLEYPATAARLSAKSKAHAYIGQMLDRRKAPERLGDFDIVRPEHRTNPHLPFKIYRRPNGVASDEPWTYLSLYSGAHATFSDRVHACVATMAYGGMAHLHNPVTRRAHLFERVGAGSVRDSLTSVDPALIDAEWETAKQFLANQLSLIPSR